MDAANVIRQGLHVQGLPAYETDIPYIHTILDTMDQALVPFTAFPHLHTEVPITIVDQEVIR